MWWKLEDIGVEFEMKGEDGQLQIGLARQMVESELTLMRHLARCQVQSGHRSHREYSPARDEL
jgi:hypothetical protein